jgi:reactive intermediate/imine deaminase
LYKSLNNIGFLAVTCLANTFLAYPALSQVQTFRSVSAPSAPYSGATRAGNTIYVGGVIGLSKNEKSLVPGGIEEEANAAFDHVIAMVEKAGGEKTDIAKCLVLVSDIDYFPTLNKVFTEKFPIAPPTRSTIVVGKIPMDAAIEVECTAYSKQ